jgi:hypothetical protein
MKLNLLLPLLLLLASCDERSPRCPKTKKGWTLYKNGNEAIACFIGFYAESDNRRFCEEARQTAIIQAGGAYRCGAAVDDD